MHKIPTLYVRYLKDRRYLSREVHPDCQWVLNGQGTATRKYDGTCVRLDSDGRWWARREVKPGKVLPPGWLAIDLPDPVTGKVIGWEPIEQASFVKYHAEAYNNTQRWGWLPGTYELIGPKINGNPEQVSRHYLIRHAETEIILDVPRDYDGLRDFLQSFQGEGIVWHHRDGRMAKVKRCDRMEDVT